MAKHLVFTLYGPLQAWGCVAVGEIRPCAARPTRSGVLGLLAAALGIRRGEEDRLRALSDGYAVAVRVDDPGERFTDYHTVQVPSEKRGRAFHCRRDELGAKLDPHEDLHTLLSRRDYLTDARFTACVRPREAGVRPTPEELRDVLLKPRFTPYLGRKSCPVALPFQPLVVEADDALGALAAYSRDAAFDPHWRRPGPGAGDVYCDEGMVPGEPLERLTSRDVLEDHARRAFGTRLEYRYPAPGGQGGE